MVPLLAFHACPFVLELTSPSSDCRLLGTHKRAPAQTAHFYSRQGMRRLGLSTQQLGEFFLGRQLFLRTSGRGRGVDDTAFAAIASAGNGLEGRGASEQKYWAVTVASAVGAPFEGFASLSPTDKAFVLLGFIACMIASALLALLAAAIPTLNAMRRAALSLERLADTAREELPSTMAAVRLSGMEFSDLTLELSDLSQEISEGVRSSARAVRAAEVGIRRIGSLAASQTLTMLQEHANFRVEAVKPVMASALESTCQAVTQVRRALLSITSLPALSKWIKRKKMEAKTN
eukprot:c24709_g1_i4 orf=425-1294(-)